MLSLSRWHAHLSPAARGALFYFGSCAAGAVYAPFLSIFYAHRGLSGSEIGLLSAVGPLMAFLVAPVLTALADRRGLRIRMMSLGLVGTAICLLALPLASTFAALLVIVSVLSIVGSPVGPIADGLLARMAERHELSYGQMRLWGSLSWALVAAGGGWLWEQAGLSLMFPVASVLFLSIIVLARVLPEDRARQPGESQPATSLRVVTGDMRLLILLLATLVLGLAMAMAGTFTGVYLDRLGGGQLLVGLFSAVTALCELPTMHWSDRIAHRLGGTRTLLLSYTLMGVGYCGLALTAQPVLLLAAGAAQGLGFGIFLPTTVRQVAVWAPEEWCATGQGLLSAATWGLAPLIASPLAGIIFDAAGPGTIFMVSAGGTVLAGCVMLAAQLAGVFKAERAPLPAIQAPEDQAIPA